MTTKIKKLTAAQTAALPAWRDKWIATGLSTAPADRERAEAAYRACYRYAGLRDDVPIVWVQSPIVGALTSSAAATILKGSSVRSAVGWAVRSAVESEVRSAVDLAMDSAVYSAVRPAVHSAVYSAVYSAVDEAVRSAVYSVVGAAAGAAVHSAVGPAVYSAADSAVREAVGAAVRSAVRSAVGAAVRSAVGSAVDDAVGSAVYSAVREAMRSAKLSWHYWLGGSLWSAWPAFESFFREHCGLILPGNLSERAAAYAATSEAACYWWPNSSFIMACERPRFIRLEDGRLHSATGHAIEWPDGWGLSAWRGTVVPDAWLSGNPPSAAEALQQQNVERRRAACEIIGWERIIAELGGKTIDRDPDPQIGELIEVNLPGSGKERFLRVKCATGRRFAIPVPRKIKTALAGNAWTYDIPPDLLATKEHRT